MKRFFPFLVTAALLSGGGAAYAAYLNFTINCRNSGSDCLGQAAGTVLFQGSIEITDTSNGNHTIPISLAGGSATIFAKNGAYYGTGQAATTSGGVTYQCSGGNCRVTGVTGLTATAGGVTYSFTGNGPSHNIKIGVPGDSDFVTNAQTGCYGGSASGYCALQTGPLHHPEINGATLPKAILLLVSVFLLAREGRKFFSLPGSRASMPELGSPADSSGFSSSFRQA